MSVREPEAIHLEAVHLEAVHNEMLGLLSGYWFSQCLYVVAKLGVVDHLRDQGLSATQLAKLSSSDPTALSRLMNALSQTGLFTRDSEQRYANTSHSLTLSSVHPNSLKWHALFGGDPLHWQAWGSLLEAIQTGDCAFELAHHKNFYSALQQYPDSKNVFDKVMAASGHVDADLAKAMHLKHGFKVVDLGGGSGNLLAQLKQQDASLNCVLYELPCVKNQETADLSATKPSGEGRFSIEYGDILDDVPEGADAYLLKFVLHNWDDNRAVRILNNCAKSMSVNSELVIIEMILPELSTGDCTGHANKHDLNMLVLTGGKERTLKDYNALLTQAKLSLAASEDAGHGLSLLRGRKTREQA